MPPRGSTDGSIQHHRDMRIADAEHIFNSCTLDLIIPGAVVHPPENDYAERSADSWLARVRADAERHKAFFDERLGFFLTIFFYSEDESSALHFPDKSTLPALLLTLLNHIQVSVDATYIPQDSQNKNSALILPASPKRTNSTGLSITPKANTHAPPLNVVPQTPNPVPATSDSDQKYVLSEGTLLKSFVWGDEPSDGDTDSFRLLYSDKENCWVAVYKLSLTIDYTQVQIRNPLLCLTASITLRDRPLPATPQRQGLTDLIRAAEDLPPLLEIQQEEKNDPSFARHPERSFLEEVNVLDGVPSEGSDDLFFPATRLGSVMRMAYSLRPTSPSLKPNTVSNTSRKLPVLRKAFRKTLPTVSGFHVRMRTVMVPHVNFPGDNGEEQEAANNESTVVLSIEIENGGESEAGFSVEGIDVSIRGGGANVRLIGWGQKEAEEASKVFPLLVRPMEQYNLLYTVRFHQPPDIGSPEEERINEFRKGVSIVVTGRPFTAHSGEATFASQILSYPTHVFQSRWNCVLDLRPRQEELVRRTLNSAAGPCRGENSALPIPASPFPTASPNAQQLQEQTNAREGTPVVVGAGFKRHTFAGMTASSMTGNSGALVRGSNARGSPSGSRPMSTTTGTIRGVGGMESLLPRLAIQSWPALPSSAPAHHTSGPLSPPLPPLPASAIVPNFTEIPHTPTPRGPRPGSQQARYSVYPEAPWQTPVPWRSSSMNSESTIIPPPPDSVPDKGLGVQGDFVVSVSLVPPYRANTVEGARVGTGGNIGKAKTGGAVEERGPGQGKGSDAGPTPNSLTPQQQWSQRVKAHMIHPLDEFALEIFVFNQSTRVRTLEASIAEGLEAGAPSTDGVVRQPDPLKEQQRAGTVAMVSSVALHESTSIKGMISREFKAGTRGNLSILCASPGFVPLESRVRIGPLGPSTCQSVSMHFMALTTGLHSIDGLVLTDFETGESITLRRVMDFAILSRTDITQ